MKNVDQFTNDGVHSNVIVFKQLFRRVLEHLIQLLLLWINHLDLEFICVPEKKTA